MTLRPELEVVREPVGARLEGSTGEGPLHQATPTCALLDIPSIARVRVEEGRRVAVQPAPGVSDKDLAWLLSGPVRQIAWLQRGSMALRASGVVIRGRAVAIAGTAAGGKSAVAAALALRGHQVLADATLPVDVEPSAIAHGVADALDLWPRAVELLGLDPAAGEVVRPGLAKRRFRFPAASHAPLVSVAILNRSESRGEPATEGVQGGAAVSELSQRTAMGPLLEPLGLTAQRFRWATRLASQVRVVRIDLDRYRPNLSDAADAVEAVA